MADTKENPIKEAPDLSPEELVAKRAEITAYYEEHIPSLQTQLEYETLLRDIEKMRAERLQAQMFVAKSMAPTPEAPDNNGRPIQQPPPPKSAKSNKVSNGADLQAAKDFIKANHGQEGEPDVKPAKTLKRT